MKKVGHFISRLLVLFFGAVLGFLMLGYVGFVIFYTVTHVPLLFQNQPDKNIILFFIILLIASSGFFLLLAPMMLKEIFSDLKMLFIKQKCTLCTKVAYDTLTGDKKIGVFCREHLIEQYKQHFKSSPFKVVMVEYQPQGIDSPSYYYYPVSEINFTGYKLDYDISGASSKAQETVRHLLEVLKNKKCKVCDKRASILFASKEIAPFKKYRTTPQEDFEEKGEYLCKEHALEKIVPALKNSSKNFDTYEGLCLPRKENGYQATVAF